MKKNFLRIFLFFLSFFAFCSKWSDRAFEIIENGSAKEIKRAIKTDYSFIKYKRAGKQNLLMAALEADRDNDVVKSLLRAGISPTSKDKNGKTALMYAIENESDVETVNTVLKYNAPFKFQRKKRILQKDKNGKVALDYAKENSKQSEIEVLFSDYVPVSSLEAENGTEPETAPDAEEIFGESVTSPESSLPAVSPPVAAAVISAVETPPLIGEKKSSEADENNKKEEIVAPQNDERISKENGLIELDKMVAPATVAESIYLYDYAENTKEDNLIPEELLKSSEFIFTESASEKESDGKTNLMKTVKNDVRQFERKI